MKPSISKIAGIALVGFAILHAGLSNAAQPKKKHKIDFELQDSVTSEWVDSVIRSGSYQFEPNTQRGQVDGTWAPYKYKHSDGLPIWIMAYMGGPVIINPETFTLEQAQKSANNWSIDYSYKDSTLGEFKLQLVVEGNGRTLLRMTDPDNEVQMYEGKIYPAERYMTFKSQGAMRRALKNQAMIDSIVPRLSFNLGAGYLLLNPTLLKREYAEVKAIEKVNEVWYLRLEFPADLQQLRKPRIRDYSINSLTCQTFVRSGYYDRLPVKWRHNKDNSIYINKN